MCAGQGINSRRFCERDAKETIHASVRHTDERSGNHLDLGMWSGCCVWWPGTPKSRLWYTRIVYIGYGKDPQED